MIDKKHFLAQIEKLEDIYGEKLSLTKMNAYYEVLSPDFTDEAFDLALNYALKTSFKFPPIAAFYKTDPAAPEEKKAYEPVTTEEAEAIRRTIAGFENEH